jgi:photosystem II stability/assembly factor-like uncharacterized protein
MKEKIFIILLFILNSVLYSQSEWIQINPGFGHNYLSVHFADSLNGLACGYSGAIAKTTNCGLNWTNINSGTTNQLCDIKYLSNQVAVIIGSNKLLLRSTDGGSNWSVVNPASGSAYLDQAEVFNIGAGNAIAYSIEWLSPSYYRTIYKTTDYGATWSAALTFCYAKYMFFLNMNTGWANGSYSAGSNFYITSEKTTNGGSDWNMTYSFQTVSVNPDFIYFLNENVGFRYLNLASFLYKTFSSGSSWNGVYYSASVDLNSISFGDNDTGYLVGSQGAILKSTNAGVNWVTQISPLSTVLNKVYMFSPRCGWIAAGSAGILVKSSGLTGLRQISDITPRSYSLSQNYPNPFNPVTKIKFDIPVGNGRDRSVTLLIYDILGREVSTLVNEQLKPGTYEVSWDGSNYASGVYFYTLNSGEISETKKLILLK